MTQGPAWREEILLGLGLQVSAALAVMAVDLSGTAWWCMFSLSYLGWHGVQFLHLIRWLRHPKVAVPPWSLGLWRPVVTGIEELRARVRKRKHKMRQMLEGFQESTDALPDATVVLDDCGRMEWWNGAATRMLGISRRQHKDQAINVVLQNPQLCDYLERADYQRPLHWPAPVDERMLLEIRVVPYGTGKRLLQARDITRLQQLETVRRDFVANVSHEMRTPLTVVHGYLETLVDYPPRDLAAAHTILKQMLQQTSRLRKIVEDLLMLARLESATEIKRLELINVPAILKVLEHEAAELSRQQHRITLTVDPSLHLDGNATELESAFSNLVFNAVRYTPPGGRIDIRWQVAVDQSPCFSVQDSGIGIAKEHLPRLTERFYRVDVGRSRQSGGTGLGLAIVKHVMTRHGGHLLIHSEPGRGSTFTCKFPVVLSRSIA